MKGHLQSKACDPTCYPAIVALGEVYRVPQRSAWKYRHDGAHGCCLDTLFAEREAGAITTDMETVPCRTCARIWQRIAGWWVIPQPKKRPKRPLESLRHGREASRRREAAKPKSLRAQWFQKREAAKP